MENLVIPDTQIDEYPLSLNTTGTRGSGRSVGKRLYRIIGRYKLYNPNPRPITPSDARFIADSIGCWLESAYPQKSFFHLNTTPALILDNMEYAFTLLSYKRILEGDFYRLKLEADDKDTVTFYIAKALSDNVTFDDTEEGIVYPFFTETWHKKRLDPDPYKPGERW